ncbi:SNX16 [Acanthosepion pharaonis]|uniref:SNX16 n=1 Tax=Acanthosepion pharaonis TaxID=158019 RepID=A0A812DFU7_ACAPH|nr:SNX16 [Sepia pharaonis]
MRKEASRLDKGCIFIWKPDEDATFSFGITDEDATFSSSITDEDATFSSGITDEDAAASSGVPTLLADIFISYSPITYFFIPLPPKRWFLDNFDRHFLEERRQGLQEFINRILSSKILCECQPVREFFCLDDPPGPHDSLEESRALCESLEEQTYNLKKELRDKEREIDLLKSELNLYKSQIEDLKRMERLEISGKSSGQDMSSASGPSDGINDYLHITWWFLSTFHVGLTCVSDFSEKFLNNEQPHWFST